MTWLSSLAALNGWRNGSLPWRPDLRTTAEALARAVADADPDGVHFAAAVDAEARRRLARFTAGVAAYRARPATERPPAAPVFGAFGATRVLDFAAGDGGGAPVLVVPSLVNRGYILDLTERRSLMRHLASVGLRPLLIEWGEPGAEETGFALADYVLRLEAIADAVAEAAGRAPAVVGYCMGGLLAMALATRRPDRVQALALLATPWDFHAMPPATTAMLAAAAPGLVHAVGRWGVLPVDVVQAMFTSLDPFLTADKFRRFAAMDPRSARARHFVTLEDWLNDGVPLAGPVAVECLTGWYVENAPALNAWEIAGRTVVPADVQAPALVVIPEQDHIVPPASAAVLADAIPNAQARWLAAGHIGMVAGSRARTMLYKPLGRWLSDAMIGFAT